MIVSCQHCGKLFEKDKNAINRAIKRGMKIFCSKTCFGLSRRKEKSIEEKKKQKQEYDKKYRLQNKERIRKEKKEKFIEYYYNGGGQEKMKEYRKTNQQKHNEYCRSEKYKKYKKEYDEKHRTKKEFGEFGEAALILFQLEDELDRGNPQLLATKFQNGTLNKTQKRKRKWQQKTH